MAAKRCFGKRAWGIRLHLIAAVRGAAPNSVRARLVEWAQDWKMAICEMSKVSP